jgi:EpsI family protein
MSALLRSWAPVAVLSAGLVLAGLVDEQHRMPLREPLATAVPAQLGEYSGRDLEISASEREVAGMDSYVLRSFEKEGSTAFTVYVGYYESQRTGRTIHSPRNCLPGAGWEPLTLGTAEISTRTGSAVVNRYIIQRSAQRALVLYWYQGRGRVEASEYRVKFDLLRDASLKGRSEEALARIVVPIHESEDAAFALAARIAGTIIPAVDRALPSS